MLFSELSRRRIRSVQKLIRIGRNEVAVVLRVDKEKGASDILSLNTHLMHFVTDSDRLYRSVETACVARGYCEVRRTVHEIQDRRIDHAPRRFKTGRQ